MIDLGISKLAMIGVVALMVIGPEKLPRVARTVGTLMGRAQRYIRDMKDEVHRSIHMDELNKMKETVEAAAHTMEQSIRTHTSEFEKSWANSDHTANDRPPLPSFRHPKKNWNLKQGVASYKAPTAMRTKVLSGAARKARLRSDKFNG
jgi:sec-independent protein translocase protein TatB